MLDYPALRAVSTVVQTGSFEKAARVLNVTPSAVSQRVKQLEERLGIVLIERGSPCVATKQGEWLCRHMENVGMLEGELFERLPGLIDPAHPRQRTTLDIAVNADSLGTWFIAAASNFSESSPYLLNIVVDDQDHTADWLRRGRVAAAVTGLEKPVPGCRRIPLGALRYHATASPDFMARHFAEGRHLGSDRQCAGSDLQPEGQIAKPMGQPDARRRRPSLHPLAALDSEFRRGEFFRHGLGHESNPACARASEVRSSGRTRPQHAIGCRNLSGRSIALQPTGSPR